jgi:hypothetical protein
MGWTSPEEDAAGVLNARTNGSADISYPEAMYQTPPPAAEKDSGRLIEQNG